MIYFLLFWEFFQIGLLAVGGGLMTIPFLFALIEKRGWFNAETLSRMIIVSESTPGPVGVNMATYTGWTTAGFWGSLVATSALVLPAFIVILLIAGSMEHSEKITMILEKMLFGIRPVVIALILSAGVQIAFLIPFEIQTVCLFLVFLFLAFYLRLNPILCLILSAVAGMVLKL